ncbi:MAG: carbohydrate-binding domain-containing protein [Oscillospiraceae bacterium]|nr:carbohydrate-binding domain-containing protein [Oscillospiraceae bacterium]
MAKKNGTSKSIAGTIVIIVIILVVLIVAVIWILDLGGNESVDGILNSDGVSSSDGESDGTGTYKELLNENALADATQAVQTTSESGDAVITLSGSSVSISGDDSGVTLEDKDIIITREGTYEFTGTLDDGRIIVNAVNQNVVLILNGVDITCSNGSAIYVYKAGTCTILLNGNTENTISDGSSYDFSLSFCDSASEEPNAAIFAKDDLIIRGTGSLIVNGNYAAGIIGKDTLKIINTNVTVTAAGNGINGKDSLTIQNSTVNVTAGKDALRSTNDTDSTLGYATFTDSNITIVAGNDGVQAETGITVSNCSISIITAGGAYETTSDSAKGLKCVQGTISIDGGSIVIDSADDSVHAAGDIIISDGVLNLSSGDDAVHSDSSVTVQGGTTVISTSSEGLEGEIVTICDGIVYINAKSNAINASNEDDTDGNVSITGGYVYISSNDDTIDSKGDITISGGTVIVNGNSDGGLKYEGNFDVDGGTILMLGYASTAKNPSSTSQNTISVSFASAVSTGSYIRISCGSEEYVFKTTKPVENILFSSSMLVTGETVTISYGGTYKNGESIDNICTGGTYSGGNELTLTVSDGLTIYG